MAIELRPATAALVLLAVLVGGLLGSVAITGTGASGEPATPETPVQAITFDNSDRQLWLFTSRAPSFETNTLPINVIVYGPPQYVRFQLLGAAGGNWNVTAADERDVDEATTLADPSALQWSATGGSGRYVYLTGLKDGVWFRSDYQVHDGEYLGSRHHIRAYVSPDPDSEWTAMQAHHEYWDWFWGRHVVTSIEESQSRVEREFAEPSSPSITRVPLETGDHVHFHLWQTVVDFRDEARLAVLLVPFLAIGGSVGFRSILDDGRLEQEVWSLILFFTVVALYAGTRATAVELERVVEVSPKLLGMGLYPVIFAGLPVATYLLARPLADSWAFSAASLGFLSAILVDYTSLGVTKLPLDLLVHRGWMAVALGLIALGAARASGRDHDRLGYLKAGILLWLAATTLPLLRHTALPV
jgi:hypothetical protein